MLINRWIRIFFNSSKDTIKNYILIESTIKYQPTFSLPYCFFYVVCYLGFDSLEWIGAMYWCRCADRVRLHWLVIRPVHIWLHWLYWSSVWSTYQTSLPFACHGHVNSELTACRCRLLVRQSLALITCECTRPISTVTVMLVRTAVTSTVLRRGCTKPSWILLSSSLS